LQCGEIHHASAENASEVAQKIAVRNPHDGVTQRKTFDGLDLHSAGSE